MEDVWKDLLSLSSRHHADPSTTRSVIGSASGSASGSTSISADPPHIRGLDLQNFLACPLSKIFEWPESGDNNKVVSKLQIKNTSGKSSCPAVDENTASRKRERLRKCKEAAERSRARKKAYTNELELEIARLRKENDKLKKHQEKVFVGVHGPYPKTQKLYRSLTSPF